MLMTLLLPAVFGIQLDDVTLENDVIDLRLQTTEPQANCPVCGHLSQEVHSHYGRNVADLPWAGIPVRVALWVRRFFCRNADCQRQIFRERLNPAIEAYARRTRRLENQLQQLSLALGSEGSSRLLTILGMSASPATLLRLIGAIDIDERPTPRVLGVDDWTREFAVYSPSGKRRWHWITLAGSFDQYLGRMSPKSRKNLKRIAEGSGRDSAEKPRIHRIDTETQVEEFLERALIVSRKSWQHRVLGPRIRKDPEEVRSMRHLARLGILRSYLLEYGDQPCAFIVGYQFRGVFNYAEIGFDQAFARLSPGSILLYLAIQDLHDVNPPKIVNFGMGDATYKSRFGNTSCEDATVLILRRTPRLRIAIAAHAAFRAAVGLGKKWMSRIFQGAPLRLRRL